MIGSKESEPSKSSKHGGNRRLLQEQYKANLNPEDEVIASQRLSKRRCVVHPKVGHSVVAVVGDLGDPFTRWPTD